MTCSCCAASSAAASLARASFRVIASIHRSKGDLPRVIGQSPDRAVPRIAPHTMQPREPPQMPAQRELRKGHGLPSDARGPRPQLIARPLRRAPPASRSVRRRKVFQPRPPSLAPALSASAKAALILCSRSTTSGHRFLRETAGDRLPADHRATRLSKAGPVKPHGQHRFVVGLGGRQAIDLRRSASLILRSTSATCRSIAIDAGEVDGTGRAVSRAVLCKSIVSLTRAAAEDFDDHFGQCADSLARAHQSPRRRHHRASKRSES